MNQQPQALSSFGEKDGVPQDLTHSKEVALDFIERFWNNGDASCISPILTDDYVDHAYEPGNAEGLLAMADRLRTAFPDQRSTVESVTAEGDRVVVRLRMKGTHLGTFRGRRLRGSRSMPGCTGSIGSRTAESPSIGRCSTPRRCCGRLARSLTSSLPVALMERRRRSSGG